MTIVDWFTIAGAVAAVIVVPAAYLALRKPRSPEPNKPIDGQGGRGGSGEIYGDGGTIIGGSGGQAGSRGSGRGGDGGSGVIRGNGGLVIGGQGGNGNGRGGLSGWAQFGHDKILPGGSRLSDVGRGGDGANVRREGSERKII